MVDKMAVQMAAGSVELWDAPMVATTSALRDVLMAAVMVLQ